MPDLTLSVAVTRSLLGLADLNINDHLNYAIGPTFLGAQVQYQRNQAASVFLNGAVTVTRNKQMVTEQVQVEVYGGSTAGLQTNLSTLLTAFGQDSFTLAISINGQTQSYACEAADYQLMWTGPRWISKQVQVEFQLPRQPDALTGGL